MENYRKEKSWSKNSKLQTVLRIFYDFGKGVLPLQETYRKRVRFQEGCQATFTQSLNENESPETRTQALGVVKLLENETHTERSFKAACWSLQPW